MVWDLFSKRRKRERGEMPDVVTYDVLSNQLRVQIVHIIQATYGDPDFYGPNTPARGYSLIAQALKEEFGLFKLVDYPKNNADDVLNFFLKEPDAERALDVVELLFRFAVVTIDEQEHYKNWVRNVRLSPSDGISQLNTRFREHGVGYEFVSGEIVRIENQVIHAEAVRPALRLLSQKGFSGPNAEFLEAHSHYRRGDFDDAVVNAAKAFESTMKTICSQRGWKYDANATAKPLINVLMTNGLLPSYFESQLSTIRSLLESTVTVRNKDAGHGAGEVPKVLPEWFARYAMNVCASAIVFLVEAHMAKK